MSARLPILATVGVPFEVEPLSAEHQRELDALRERELRILRDELTQLCTHVEYLRAWFDFYKKDIRAMSNRAGASVIDHFVDASVFARIIARAAGLDIDRESIQAKDWAATSPALIAAPEVGPAPALEYIGAYFGQRDIHELAVEAYSSNGRGIMTLQESLRRIDEFAEPGRTRLLFAAGLHFGVTMNRGAA